MDFSQATSEEWMLYLEREPASDTFCNIIIHFCNQLSDAQLEGALCKLKNYTPQQDQEFELYFQAQNTAFEIVCTRDDFLQSVLAQLNWVMHHEQMQSNDILLKSSITCYITITKQLLQQQVYHLEWFTCFQSWLIFPNRHSKMILMMGNLFSNMLQHVYGTPMFDVIFPIILHCAKMDHSVFVDAMSNSFQTQDLHTYYKEVVTVFVQLCLSATEKGFSFTCNRIALLGALGSKKEVVPILEQAIEANLSSCFENPLLLCNMAHILRGLCRYISNRFAELVVTKYNFGELDAEKYTEAVGILFMVDDGMVNSLEYGTFAVYIEKTKMLVEKMILQNFSALSAVFRSWIHVLRVDSCIHFAEDLCCAAATWMCLKGEVCYTTACESFIRGIAMKKKVAKRFAAKLLDIYLVRNQEWRHAHPTILSSFMYTITSLIQYANEKQVEQVKDLFETLQMASYDETPNILLSCEELLKHTNDSFRSIIVNRYAIPILQNAENENVLATSKFLTCCLQYAAQYAVPLIPQLVKFTSSLNSQFNQLRCYIFYRKQQVTIEETSALLIKNSGTGIYGTLTSRFPLQHGATFMDKMYQLPTCKITLPYEKKQRKTMCIVHGVIAHVKMDPFVVLTNFTWLNHMVRPKLFPFAPQLHYDLYVALHNVKQRVTAEKWNELLFAAKPKVQVATLQAMRAFSVFSHSCKFPFFCDVQMLFK